MPRTSDWLAGNLIGKPVRNAAGETLGKLEELVVDPASGNVMFGILSLSGLSGMSDRLVAVPWNALGHVAGRDYVLLDMDKNVLEHAPSFTRNEWPDVSDSAWRSRVYGHYHYPDPAVMRDRTVVV